MPVAPQTPPRRLDEGRTSVGSPELRARLAEMQKELSALQRQLELKEREDRLREREERNYRESMEGMVSMLARAQQDSERLIGCQEERLGQLQQELLERITGPADHGMGMLLQSVGSDLEGSAGHPGETPMRDRIGRAWASVQQASRDLRRYERSPAGSRRREEEEKEESERRRRW